MLDSVILGNQRIKLEPTLVIGKGGEADVYQLPSGDALKIFKTPDHLDYRLPDGSADVIEQRGAEARIAEHQHKLQALRLLARRLPDSMVTPKVIATVPNQDTVAGYSMNFKEDTELLLRLSERDFHDKGFTDQSAVEVLVNLHKTVASNHEVGLMLGDFNNLNVLVSDNNDVFVIDTDSAQFDQYMCNLFTERFVDILLCDMSGKSLMLNQPHTAYSDWYAFAVIVMYTLLCAGPYSGTYREKGKRKALSRIERQRRRLTVFNPHVRYPKAGIAFPLKMLSDDLLQYLWSMFIKDIRKEFPRGLLTSMRWTTCTICGFSHARDKCPSCDKAPDAAITVTIQRKGKVQVTSVFKTKGTIVFAAHQEGKLRWLYHANGFFCRNTGGQHKGDLNPRYRYRIYGDKTIIGKHKMVAIFNPNGSMDRIYPESYRQLPMFDATATRYYWTLAGRLLSSDGEVETHIGNVLTNQTLFWVGPTFGFGFYNAGNVNIAFVFDVNNVGLNDNVQLPFMKGQLIDSSCVFSKNICWLFVTLQDSGRTVRYCATIRADGRVVALGASGDVGGDSWLSTIRGKCAVGKYLFAPTDLGIVRVEEESDVLKVTAEFPDTESFVSSGSHLFAGDGLYVVERQTITQIKLS